MENTEENRRAYRQMLFETPGCNEFLCAAILDPETVYQKSSTSNKLFPEVLTGLGIVPGIKPHLKVYAIPGQAGSTVMQGLDSLAARCKEYKAAGIKFAKWRRCVLCVLRASVTGCVHLQHFTRYARRSGGSGFD